MPSFFIHSMIDTRDRKSTRLNSSHRNLPSFPTRRSSDLLVTLLLPPGEAFVEVAVAEGRIHAQLLHPLHDRHSRSEEHTSELQSPESTLFPYTTLFRSSRYASSPPRRSLR